MRECNGGGRECVTCPPNIKVGCVWYGASVEWAEPDPRPLRAEQEIQDLASHALFRANDNRNAAKGEWSRSRWVLFYLLLIEVWELCGALVWLAWCEWRHTRVYSDMSRYGRATAHVNREKARDHVKHEAGDCAAYLAFIVDRV